MREHKLFNKFDRHERMLDKNLKLKFRKQNSNITWLEMENRNYTVWTTVGVCQL